MLVATFGTSTEWAGKRISYDDGQFVLEGVGVISPEAVLDYDGQGHLIWAYEGLQEWTAGLASAATAAPTRPVAAAGLVEPPKSRHRGLKIAGIVAGVVVGLLLLLAVIGAIIGGGSTSTSESSSSTVGTATTAPATSTPTKSAAAKALITPTPTSTPLTPKETKYLRDAGASATDLGSAFTTVSKLAGEWPWNDNQTLRMAAALATMQVTYNQWKSRKAPSPRMERVHRLWLSALKTYDKAATRLAYGVDNLDVNAINQANQLMQQGQSLIVKVNREMKRLKAQAGQ